MVKVEADPNPNLVEKYQVIVCGAHAVHVLRHHLLQVYGLPTLLIVKDGVMLEGSKHEGAIGKEKLMQYLESNGLTKVNV